MNSTRLPGFVAFAEPSRANPRSRLPRTSTPSVHRKIDPTFSDRAALSLDGALQLLQQSGQALPDRKSAPDFARIVPAIDPFQFALEEQ